MLIPKFIPMPIEALKQGYWLVEACIIGYLDFYQRNDDFYCTNEELAELLCLSEATIKRALKTLLEDWIVEYSKTMKEWGWQLRKIELTQNGLLLAVNMSFSKGSNWAFHNINKEYIEKELKESWKIPTPSELVEAYRNTPQLVEKIKDEWAVRQRAEYKQKKKSKAYKTINWFIQQLVENVTTVSFGEIRYDVWDRLRYAQNKAIDWDNQWIRRDDRMERWFNNWKKFNSLSQKQNEWQSS